MGNHLRSTILFAALLTVNAGVIFDTALTEAVSFPDSLWLGNDTNASLPVLNTDKTGTVLRSSAQGNVTGIAVDVPANTIWFSPGGVNTSIAVRDLDTLASKPPGNVPTSGSSFSEDLAWDGSALWRGDFTGNDVHRVDPNTGSNLFVFTPEGVSGVVGVAWDGSAVWVAGFTNRVVRRYNPDGTFTGTGFTVGGAHGGDRVGGLAFDTTDNTLWLGSDSTVIHLSATGTFLGAFSTPDNRFVDALEYQGFATSTGVPEPGMLVLLVTGAAGLAFGAWRGR